MTGAEALRFAKDNNWNIVPQYMGRDGRLMAFSITDPLSVEGTREHDGRYVPLFTIELDSLRQKLLEQTRQTQRELHAFIIKTQIEITNALGDGISEVDPEFEKWFVIDKGTPPDARVREAVTKHLVGIRVRLERLEKELERVCAAIEKTLYISFAHGGHMTEGGEPIEEQLGAIAKKINAAAHEISDDVIGQVIEWNQRLYR